MVGCRAMQEEEGDPLMENLQNMSPTFELSKQSAWTSLDGGIDSCP